MLMQNEEEGFLKRLKENKLEGQIKNIKMNQAKQQTIQKQFQSLAFKFPEIKFLGQRAFISYIKSLHLQKDKTIFKKEDLVNKELVDLDKFAASLGLPGAPKIKFLNKKEASEKKNKARVVEAIKVAPMKDFESDVEEDGEEDEGDGDVEDPANGKEREDDETSSDSDEVETDDEDDAEELSEQIADEAPTLPKAAVQSKTPKYDKLYKRKNQGILSDHYAKVIERDEDNDDASKISLLAGGEDEQEDFITLARPRHDLTDENGADLADDGNTLDTLKHEDLSKRRTKLGITKKGLLKLRGQGEKLVFDDDGKSHAIYELLGEAELGDQAAVEAERKKFVEEESRRMQEVDSQDKEAIKNLKREKKLKRKEREREVRFGRREDGARGAEIAELEDGEDGIKEIDFDLPSDDDLEAAADPQAKRGRQEEEDELEMQALRALKRGRR
jgi:ATP-dependent RNA helicase DDX10/DBP4